MLLNLATGYLFFVMGALFFLLSVELAFTIRDAARALKAETLRLLCLISRNIARPHALADENKAEEAF